MNQYCILVHYHELGLKKDNKTWFEKIFQQNISTHVKNLEFQNINTYASRVLIYGIDQKKWGDYRKKLKRIDGSFEKRFFFAFGLAILSLLRFLN